MDGIDTVYSLSEAIEWFENIRGKPGSKKKRRKGLRCIYKTFLYDRENNPFEKICYNFDEAVDFYHLFIRA